MFYFLYPLAPLRVPQDVVVALVFVEKQALSYFHWTIAKVFVKYTLTELIMRNYVLKSASTVTVYMF